MRTVLEPAARRLVIHFDSTAEAEVWASGIESESGFLVQLSTPLALHQELTVALAVAADAVAPCELAARVVQVFDKGFGRFGTALMVDDPAAPGRWLASPDGAEASGVESARDEAAAPPEAPPSDMPEPVDEGLAGEMRGTSPIHRIKQLNPRQRALLALKAGRTERQILLRDSSPQVLQNLLNNPHVDAEEVLQIARSSHVVAPVLQRIAGDARWNTNQEILASVVRHPKTPSLFASRLVGGLRTSDLRLMAKMSTGLKDVVRKAALKEYMRRTGQRI